VRRSCAVGTLNARISQDTRNPSSQFPPPYCSKLHSLMEHQKATIELSKMLFAVGPIMDMNERQIALSVLESLRGDLIYAHLNGSRVLDVADIRQYIYEQMGRIRTNALAMDALYGNDNGHNGKAHL
jgi:hypothetical protein